MHTSHDRSQGRQEAGPNGRPAVELEVEPPLAAETGWEMGRGGYTNINGNIYMYDPL